MMTSPLDSEEIEFLRSFKKTAIVLMLLVRLDRPVGEGEIAGLLDISPKTVRRYLRSLADSCLVARARRYHGWTLTSGGRRLVLGEAGPPLLAQSDRPEQAEGAGGIRTDVGDVKSRSSGKNGRSSETIGGSHEISAIETEPEKEPGTVPTIEPDPSIHEPVRENGMTAARAWEAVRRQLRRDMPKSAYDAFVRDLVFLSARDGTFVFGAENDYAREWLECRVTSSIRRLLTGICSQSAEIKFVNVIAIEVTK